MYFIIAQFACDDNPKSQPDSSGDAAREVRSARERLASLLNAGAETNIAFAFNCTDALNLAIKGALRYGDHVITTQLEHNSVLRPINALAARGRISLSIVSPRADGFTCRASSDTPAG